MAGFCLRRGLSRIARRQSARLPGRPGGGGAPSRTFLGRARAFRTTALTQVPEKADEEVEPNSGKPKAILDWRREIYTIPNALTFARIGATPALAYMIVDGGYPLEVFLGCAACGAMDGLDGYIARNFDQASVIGSYIDPLADKILLGGVAGAMACESLVVWWRRLHRSTWPILSADHAKATRKRTVAFFRLNAVFTAFLLPSSFDLNFSHSSSAATLPPSPTPHNTFRSQQTAGRSRSTSSPQFSGEMSRWSG